jgi:hypothetical protein
MLARTAEDRRYAAIANKLDDLRVAVEHLEELLKKRLPAPRPPAGKDASAVAA